MARKAGPGSKDGEMKRVVTWAFYAIGAIAIAYLALYAYVLLTGRNLLPGEPIRILNRTPRVIRII